MHTTTKYILKKSKEENNQTKSKLSTPKKKINICNL